MSGEWNRVLERDPALCERLAAQGDLTAGLIMKAREVEAERQRRREREAEQYRLYEEAQHRRVIEAARPPAPPIVQPEPVTQADLEAAIWEMAKAIAAGVNSEVTAPILARLAELERLQHAPGDAWVSRAQYRPNDIVKFGNQNWICRQPARGLRPDLRPSHWELYPPAAAAPSPTELAPLVVNLRDGRDRR